MAWSSAECIATLLRESCDARSNGGGRYEWRGRPTLARGLHLPCRCANRISARVHTSQHGSYTISYCRSYSAASTRTSLDWRTRRSPDSPHPAEAGSPSKVNW